MSYETDVAGADPGLAAEVVPIYYGPGEAAKIIFSKKILKPREIKESLFRSRGRVPTENP